MEEKNSEKKERKMRDSGIPWIGEVPEGWGIHPLYSYFAERKNKNSMLQEQNLLSLSYGKIIRKDINTNGGLLPANFTTYNIVQPNDIVIRPTDLQNDKKSLRTGLVTEKEIITSAYISLQPIANIYIKYFHYLLHSYDINKVFYNMGNGVRQGLNYSEFSKLMLLCPGKEEQHRIADFLDSKCSEIDTLIENLRARVESAKEYKKAVITEAVTKGLDKGAKMKDSGVEWIGEVPEGWKIVRFKHIASIKSNLVQPDKYMKYPQIAPDNIEKDTGRLLSHQTVEESGIISGNHLFYRGQILYSKIRPNLNKLTVAPLDGLCSADMYPIESKLPTLFMVYSMLSTYFVSQVSLIIQDRVKMPKINQEELGEIKVVVPSQQEMLTIADYLDSKCSEIDALLQNYEDQIATLEEYKKSLIYEYVTGKKEVPVA